MRRLLGEPTSCRVGSREKHSDLHRGQALERTLPTDYTSRVRSNFSTEGARLETHGPLGTLWASIGLGLFYIALIWLNTLLGFVLTPLFIIPATWLMDRLDSRRRTT